MFRRKHPKIVTVSSCAVGELIFLFGVDKYGQCYTWRGTENAWKPYVIEEQPPLNTPNLGGGNV